MTPNRSNSLLSPQPPEVSPSPDTAWQRSWHEPWAGLRWRIIHAYESSADPDLINRAARLRECGVGATHVYDPVTERHWLRGDRCTDRTCPRCGLARSLDVAARLLRHIETFLDPRCLVLTLASTDALLRDQVDRLFKCFRRFRHWAYRLELMTAGFYTTEITYNRKTRLWHPHLHIIYDGSYMPQKQVASAWFRITGDSSIVHISAVRDAERAAHELCKYVGKPQDVGHLPYAAICEYAVATKGRRMFQTFGHCPPLPADDGQDDPPMSDDAVSISPARIVALARGGSLPACLLVDLLARHCPGARSFYRHEMPQLVPAEQQTGWPALLATLPPPRGPPPRRSSTRRSASAAIGSYILTAFRMLLHDLACPVFNASQFDRDFLTHRALRDAFDAAGGYDLGGWRLCSAVESPDKPS